MYYDMTRNVHNKRKAELNNFQEVDGMKKFICTVCGYVNEGETAPEVCPVCKHPQSYFEVRKENY